jgi:hypothetical protein
MRIGLAILLAAAAGHAGEPTPAPDTEPPWRRTAVLNAVVVGGFLSYGAVFWDYGLHQPRAFDEGWFGRSTLHGGVDKLGHAYTNLVAATLFADIYRSWGWDRPQAAALGAGSSLLATTLMEVGDAFSPAHGFSPQDVAFNAAGCALAWWRSAHPGTRDWFDLRLEWLPSRTWRAEARRGALPDPTTDYAGMTYLLAVTARGPVRTWDLPRWLEPVEVHLAYRAIGFEPGDHRQRDREFAIGFGLDGTWLAERLGAGGAGGILDYLQIATLRIEPFAWSVDR